MSASAPAAASASPAAEASPAAGEASARDEHAEARPAPPRARRDKPARLGFTWMVCSLMMVASLLLVIWNLQEGSLENANTGSRYATIESLVDHGTYYIDKSRYNRTIDKYTVGGHFISSKPPTLPTIGAGVYWTYQKLTGKTIARHEGDVVRTVSFFTGGVGHIVFLIYFYRLCRLLFRRQRAVIVAMAGACFAYLGVGYATHINELSTAGALAIVGLYYAARIRLGRDAKPWHWPLAGLVLGLLPAIDLPALAISGSIALYLCFVDWKKALLWFAPALLPGLILHLSLVYEISGSFKPFYMNSALKTHSQFYFRNPAGIDALREPKWLYAFNVLLGHHGLFSMTPIFCFGFYELVRSLKARRWLAESLVCAASVAAFLVFVIWRTRNYGGWCVGMRWLVPIMPLLLLYFGFWIDRVRVTRLLWALVLLAFSVSCFNVQDALSSPYQYSVWHNWLEGRPNRARVGKVFNLPKRSSRPKSKSKPKPKPPVRPKTEPLPQAQPVPLPPPADENQPPPEPPPLAPAPAPAAPRGARPKPPAEKAAEKPPSETPPASPAAPR